jgi:hypothetical protein
MDINASSAFKLTRIVKDLSSVVEDKLKTEKRILEKYTEKDSDGNPTKAKDASGNFIEGAVNLIDADAFTKEMSDLMEVEITISHEKLNFDNLGLTTAKIKDLIRLEFLFI